MIPRRGLLAGPLLLTPGLSDARATAAADEDDRGRALRQAVAGLEGRPC